MAMAQPGMFFGPVFPAMVLAALNAGTITDAFGSTFSAGGSWPLKTSATAPKARLS